MRKLHFALLLTSFSLLITSCQKTGTKVEPVDPGHDNHEKRTSSSDNPSDNFFIEINCNDGCSVKEGEIGDIGGYQTNFKQYYKVNKGIVNFTFSKTSDDVEYPSLIATTDDGEAAYEYDVRTGILNVDISQSSKGGVNKITFEAGAPAVEFTFGGVDSNVDTLPVSISCEGVVKAIDFGGGNVIRNIPNLPITGNIAIVGGEGSLKLYGTYSSISLLQDDSTTQMKTYTYMNAVHLNHSVKTLDFNLFTVTSNVKKLYIGSDIEEIKYPEGFDSLASDGRILFTNLEEVVVSKDNRHFDSRDNCGCLINSATSELIIGGGKGFIPNGVTTIKKAAFSTNSLLDYVRIPDSVTKIESFAFMFSSISYVELSSNLKSVGRLAFGRCSNLYIADFSRLSHAPYMTFEAFIDSRLMLPVVLDKDKKPIFESTFLHSNPQTMAVIANELLAIDMQWEKIMEEGVFSTEFTQLPSFVCVNKLRPGYKDETVDIMLTSTEASNKFSYSYIIDNDFETSTKCNNWDYQTQINAQKTYSKSLNSYCIMSFVRNDSSLPASFTPMFNDERHGYEPFGNNADDIVFIKYFGQYSRVSDDQYVIPTKTFANLTALKHFEFAKCIDTGKDFVNGKLDTIEAEAFRNTGLVSLEIPSILKTISEGAFQDCYDLKDLNFEPTKPTEKGVAPDYLVLKPYSFAGDASIEELNLPCYIDVYGDGKDENPIGNPFIGCTSLKKLDVDINPVFEPKIMIHDKYPGVIYHKQSDRFLTCVNNFSYLSQASRGCSFGFYSTLNVDYLTVDAASYRNSSLEYAFAYSPAKKITLFNCDNLKAKSYMFAYCINLEVLDLSKLYSGQLIEDTSAHDLFAECNPNFKVWVSDSSEISTYASILHIDSSHIIVKPSSAI